MFRKLLVSIAAVLALAGSAFAVEVNSVDKAALDAVKGIGPQTAAAIVAERDKNGKFKDWDDFIKRVKGVGVNNSTTMSQAGLTVNGQAKPNAPAKAAAKTAKKAATAEKAEKAEKSMAKSGDDNADSKATRTTRPAQPAESRPSASSGAGKDTPAAPTGAPK